MCDHTKIFVIVESELIFRIQGFFFFFFSSSWDMMQGYEIGFRVGEKKSVLCACTCVFQSEGSKKLNSWHFFFFFLHPIKSSSV